jgi:hypothetical protein
VNEDNGLRAIVKADVRKHKVIYETSVPFLFLYGRIAKGMRGCNRNDSDNAEEVY